MSGARYVRYRSGSAQSARSTSRRAGTPTPGALGPGGFASVERHYRLAAGENDARHWHVDYLLGHAGTRPVTGVRSPGVAAECAVARAIADATSPVPGVGASDCECESPLAYADDEAVLRGTVRRAHERVRD